MIETGRHMKLPPLERICKVCHNGVEDEKHFLLICSPLEDVRLQFPNIFRASADHYQHNNILKRILNPPADLSRTVGKLIALLQEKRNTIINGGKINI